MECQKGMKQSTPWSGSDAGHPTKSSLSAYDQNEREHLFYAAEDRRDDPKESFQLINSVLREQYDQWNTLCDVGCAAGDFLYYMQQENGQRDGLTGIDSFDELLNTARERVPECRFLKGDIWSGEGLPTDKFDVVCMSGVLSLFDDFKKPFEHLIKMTKPGGKILVFNPFNSRGCHVEHHYKINGELGRIVICSHQEIGQWLKERGFMYEFIPFQIKSKLEENHENPLRTFTVPLKNGTNGIVNGVGIWFEQYLLKIDMMEEIPDEIL